MKSRDLNLVSNCDEGGGGGELLAKAEPTATSKRKKKAKKRVITVNNQKAEERTIKKQSIFKQSDAFAQLLSLDPVAVVKEAATTDAETNSVLEELGTFANALKTAVAKEVTARAAAKQAKFQQEIEASAATMDLSKACRCCGGSGEIVRCKCFGEDSNVESLSICKDCLNNESMRSNSNGAAVDAKQCGGCKSYLCDSSDVCVAHTCSTDGGCGKSYCEDCTELVSCECGEEQFCGLCTDVVCKNEDCDQLLCGSCDTEECEECGTVCKSCATETRCGAVSLCYGCVEDYDCVDCDMCAGYYG